MTRRAGIIATAVGLSLCVLAWGASIAQVTWRDPKDLRGVAALWSGMLMVHNGGSYTRGGWQIGPTARRIEWWPYDGKFWQYYAGTAQWPGAHWSLKLPLWMPAAACAGGLFGFWRPWDRRARRRRLGLCERCGYDIKGVVGCPECGRGRMVPEPPGGGLPG